MLKKIYKWAPFRIDALGIVTLLGSEEVDKSIGRLIENPWVEYLPLLGAFVVAGDRFVRPIPGFVLYNVSDGIMATDVAGWFSRWLSTQKLNWNTTFFIWGVRQKVQSVWHLRIPALIIGLIINSALIVLAILVRDWFGFANAIAMTVSVLVRWYLVKQHRDFLDQEAASLSGSDLASVKILCQLDDGRAVTLLAPRGIVRSCFLTTPRFRTKNLYDTVRALGWLGFGCHVICIGQSTLFIQILTVVIMVTATVLHVRGLGCNVLHLGRRMDIYRVDSSPDDDFRTMAYIRLQLSSEEEQNMLTWSLFPQRSNHKWWENYENLKLAANESHK